VNTSSDTTRGFASAKNWRARVSAKASVVNGATGWALACGTCDFTAACRGASAIPSDVSLPRGFRRASLADARGAEQPGQVLRHRLDVRVGRPHAHEGAERIEQGEAVRYLRAERA